MRLVGLQLCVLLVLSARQIKSEPEKRDVVAGKVIELEGSWPEGAPRPNDRHLRNAASPEDTDVIPLVKPDKEVKHKIKKQMYRIRSEVKEIVKAFKAKRKLKKYAFKKTVRYNKHLDSLIEQFTQRIEPSRQRTSNHKQIKELYKIGKMREEIHHRILKLQAVILYDLEILLHYLQPQESPNTNFSSKTANQVIKFLIKEGNKYVKALDPKHENSNSLPDLIAKALGVPDDNGYINKKW